MAHPHDWSLDCKVYVGDLGHGCPKHELEEKFSKYGNLKNVWVARRPAGFAFVEFDDPRDAEDAVQAMDGARINGRHVRVEMSTGRSRGGRNFHGPPRGRLSNDDYRFPRRDQRKLQHHQQQQQELSPSPRRFYSRSKSLSLSPPIAKGSADRRRRYSISRSRSRSRS